MEENVREIKKARFRIDENNLEQEWLRIPCEIFYWSKMLAELRKKRTEMEYKIEFMEAEAETKIRANPEEYGLTKITEAVIKAQVALQPEIHEFKGEIHEVTMDIMIANGALDAVMAMKSALPDLIKLKMANLYADPKEPDGFDGAEWRRNESATKVDSKIARKVSSKRENSEEE
jgi:hypothetical protein